VSQLRLSQSINASVFARRLRQARLRVGIAQDKLGVKIGLDETVASARISRYESGVHEPPIKTARDIAQALGVPLGYLYCDDDRLAEIILAASELPDSEQEQLLQSLRIRLEQLNSASPPKRR
jgi:transcriptional regulator with XRE-family HTH domain